MANVTGIDWLTKVKSGIDAASGAATGNEIGEVKLASLTDALAATDAEKCITPYTLGEVVGRFRLFAFNGLAVAGGVPVAELKAGDLILSVVVTGLETGNKSSAFESVVSVDGQIQQTISDATYPTKSFVGLILKKT